MSIYIGCDAYKRYSMFAMMSEDGPESGLNEESILTALKDGHSIIIDGPLVIFGIDKDGDRKLIKSKRDIIPGDDDQLPIGSNTAFLIKWDSSKRYRDYSDGKIDSLLLVTGGGEISWWQNEVDVHANEDYYEWSPRQPSTPKTYYYRAEARVKDDQGNIKYRAYTNPIWIRWTESSVSPYIEMEPDRGTVGTVFRNSSTGFTHNNTASIWEKQEGQDPQKIRNVNIDSSGNSS